MATTTFDIEKKAAGVVVKATQMIKIYPFQWVFKMEELDPPQH